jgi:hypothetical protein
MLKRVLDSEPYLRIGSQFFCVHYLHSMSEKYVDNSKTQGFDTIGQLIKEMTDTSFH